MRQNSKWDAEVKCGGILGDFVSGGFLIRDAAMRDLDDMCRLGSLLNTINLPADQNELKKVIETSETSFALGEPDMGKRAFLFALVDADDRVVGCSQIFSKHGTLESPQLYFQISQDERYSKTLKRYFRHTTLRLVQSYDGPTELGSLVLKNRLRSSPEKLGKRLSYVRFLFMAMKRDLFSERLVADLLPPLGPRFESALWDAIGRKFTGLDYYEADMLSRQNKEFIETLFPKVDIYVPLLPQEAQDVIGKVGQNAQSAAYLLSKIGFEYSHRVNAFDGGPNYEAKQKDISIIKQTKFGGLRTVNQTYPEAPLMIARFNPNAKSGSRFRSVFSPGHYDSQEKAIYVDETTKWALRANDGEPVAAIDLSAL